VADPSFRDVAPGPNDRLVIADEIVVGDRSLVLLDEARDDLQKLREPMFVEPYAFWISEPGEELVEIGGPKKAHEPTLEDEALLEGSKPRGR
jgi:hypothetical protein